MSNVASLENSKRLYELLGWELTASVIGKNEVYIRDWYWQLKGKVQPEPIERYKLMPDHTICPAYSAGYLLRKLPQKLKNFYTNPHTLNAQSLHLRHNKNYWLACYPSTDFQCGADTPEDALCLLAIKLAEEGILTQ